MLVETFPVGVLSCNCTVIACERTREAIVVDPGGDADRILDLVRGNHLVVKHVLHTHAHFDHVLGTREVKEATGASLHLHAGDDFLYRDLARQASWIGLELKDEAPPIDSPLQDGETITFGDHGTLVLHTPGHTPGSVSFSLSLGDEMLLLSGDTLFKGSIGRTDLPGGDTKKILASIKTRLLTLDDDTRVIPGHGPETRIGLERRKNPFLQDLVRGGPGGVQPPRGSKRPGGVQPPRGSKRVSG
ncbi:MBL fold metallo-hydrolase [bacterium]|nr:MBL fold metallo-hydrolase [bacterium]